MREIASAGARGATLAVAGVGGDGDEGAATDGPAIRIGAQNFGESAILAESEFGSLGVTLLVGSSAREFILCSIHGAAYDPHDGRCIGGPCGRGKLTVLRVEERDGQVYWYPSRDTRPAFDETPGPYAGPVPIVTHLHGTELKFVAAAAASGCETADAPARVS